MLIERLDYFFELSQIALFPMEYGKAGYFEEVELEDLSDGSVSLKLDQNIPSLWTNRQLVSLILKILLSFPYPAVEKKTSIQANSSNHLVTLHITITSDREQIIYEFDPRLRTCKVGALKLRGALDWEQPDENRLSISLSLPAFDETYLNDGWNQWLVAAGQTQFQESLNLSSGKYLYQKVTHDVLEAITSYGEAVRLLQSMPGEVDANTLELLLSWKSTTETWRQEILSQIDQHEEHSDASLEWAKLIHHLGWVIKKSSGFTAVIRGITPAKNQDIQRLLEIILRQIGRLESISQAIQVQDYLMLLST